MRLRSASHSSYFFESDCPRLRALARRLNASCGCVGIVGLWNSWGQGDEISTWLRLRDNLNCDFPFGPQLRPLSERTGKHL